MDPIVNEASEKMEKSINSLLSSFSKLRSGRANPATLFRSRLLWRQDGNHIIIERFHA